MQLPAFAVVLIGVVSLGRIFTVHLIHGEYGVRSVALFTPSYFRIRLLLETVLVLEIPRGVDEVTHVHDVKTQLEAMLGLANLEFEILQQTEVKRCTHGARAA